MDNPDRLLQATVLAIGDELILGQRLDTNSQWISEQLLLLGVRVVEHMTVADDARQIAGALAHLSQVAPLLVTTGGLGPTLDDLTRQALASALGESLVEDTQAMEWLDAWFETSKLPMPESNRVQTLRPASARVLPNTHGTAPGLAATLNQCEIFCLPGPPSEMRPMFERELHKICKAYSSQVRVATLKTVGLAEARIATKLAGLMRRENRVLVGTTASDGIISIRIRCEKRSDESLFEETFDQVRQKLGTYLYAESDASLPEHILGLLREHHATITTAESCTGGMLSASLTDCPGASDSYAGGWVTYTNSMKMSQLGVPERVIEEHGAVSAQCVEHMARGAQARAGTSHALAVSGIAGPDGGTADKPVGTVWIAHAWESDRMDARCFRFTGDRAQVRTRATTAALAMLRQNMLGIKDAPLLWQFNASP
jgi:competence/damage-inducible protein CinA-like protein